MPIPPALRENESKKEWTNMSQRHFSIFVKGHAGPKTLNQINLF